LNAIASRIRQRFLHAGFIENLTLNAIPETAAFNRNQGTVTDNILNPVRNEKLNLPNGQAHDMERG
jgi:hypothetical protein